MVRLSFINHNEFKIKIYKIFPIIPTLKYPMQLSNTLFRSSKNSPTDTYLYVKLPVSLSLIEFKNKGFLNHSLSLSKQNKEN